MTDDDARSLILSVLNRSGDIRDGSVPYFLNIFMRYRLDTLPKTLLREGDLASKDDLSSFGLKTRRHVSRQYLSNLSAAALPDFYDASYRLSINVRTALHTRIVIERMRDLGLGAKLRTGNAVTCFSAFLLEEASTVLSLVPDLPLPECDVICRCRYMPCLPLADTDVGTAIRVDVL